MDVRGIGQGGLNLSLMSEQIVTNDNVQVPNVNINEQVGSNFDDASAANDKKLSEKEVKKAVEKLNKFLEDDKTHAEYGFHEKLGDLMIKIVDDQTGKVVQELPPKKILDMVAKMCEMVGILFDKKA